jgi:hypothetical protein
MASSNFGIYFARPEASGEVVIEDLAVEGRAVEGRPSEAFVAAYSASAVKIRPVPDVNTRPVYMRICAP